MKFCRVVFLFVLLCSGCSLAQTPTTVPDGGITFRDPEYGYSLRLPAGSLYWDSDSLKRVRSVSAARVERDLGAIVAWRAYDTTMVSGKGFGRTPFSTKTDRPS